MQTTSSTDTAFIEHTLKVWQPRLERQLTSEDARQIVENVTGFFAILGRWSQLEGDAASILTVNPIEHPTGREVRRDR